MFNKNKLILLLLVAGALTASSVLADTLTSGTYTINDSVTSGGQQLTSGTYNIIDLKGQGAAGVLTSGTYTLGLGGIYQLFGAGVSGKLSISRSPNGDIVLTWGNGAKPDIWYMTGDGTGKYANSYDAKVWTKVSATTTGFTWSPDGLSLTHAAASNSTPTIHEVYYKALPAGFTPPGAADANKKTPFDLAPAVGKVDMNCIVGFNLISLPFTYDTGGDALEKVFGTQVTVNDNPNLADEIYYKQDPGSWGMTNAFEKTDNKWYLSAAPATPANFGVSRERGYLLCVKSAPKTITAVGNVAITDQPISLSTGFNAFGIVFPVSCSLDSLNLLAVTNVTASDAPSSADEIYYKNDPASWGMTNAFLKSDGKWYLSANPRTLATFGLALPNGYYYSIKKADTTINWQRSLP